MKKTITTLVFAILSVIAFSQNSNDTEKSNHVCVSTPQTNVLYRGVENPVCIAASGYSNEELIVTVSEGAEIKKIDNNFVITIKSTSLNFLTLTVGVKENGRFKELNKTEIRVLDVPAPMVLACGAYIDGSNIPKAAIKANPHLIVKIGDTNFPILGVKYEVVEYTFIYKERGVNHTIRIKSSSISEEIIEIVDNLEPESMISFTNIVAKLVGSDYEVKPNGITLTIK